LEPLPVPAAVFGKVHGGGCGHAFGEAEGSEEAVGFLLWTFSEGLPLRPG